MKKFIFTAIAMVAFGGISMASTIELEEKFKIINLEIEILKNANDLLPVTPLQCTAVKFEAYNQYIAGGYSRDEANYMSYVTYYRCMGNVFQTIP
jgi:hypothetical protein